MDWIKSFALAIIILDAVYVLGGIATQLITNKIVMADIPSIVMDAINLVAYGVIIISYVHLWKQEKVKN